MSTAKAVEMRLYGREHCHLCEQAEQLLAQLGLDYLYIDIDESAELGAQYGLRIPVLATSQAELDWPFDLQNLALWYEANA